MRYRTDSRSEASTANGNTYVEINISKWWDEHKHGVSLYEARAVRYQKIMSC